MELLEQVVQLLLPRWALRLLSQTGKTRELTSSNARKLHKIASFHCRTVVQFDVSTLKNLMGANGCEIC